MTKTPYFKEKNQQDAMQADLTSSTEAEQILHLKRLLVTLKQHYEKSLHQGQIELQVAQNQNLATQKELDKVQNQLIENQKSHEEEVNALREQQNLLKELLKKAQDELKEFHKQTIPGKSHLEKSNKKEVIIEVEHLQVELSEARKKLKSLEQELLENQQKAQYEIQYLQQVIDEKKWQESELETVVSTTSSHHLRRELETIKRTLAQGVQEAKATDARYVEILNEKINVEHQCKQLQIQLEHQSSNLISFQEQIQLLEDRKKILEGLLQAKEAEWAESCQHRQDLQLRLEHLSELVKEKDLIQDKYEQLKDEWKQLNEELQEAVDLRIQTDQHLSHLEAIAENQEVQLQEFAEQLKILNQEKRNLESERDQLKILLDESEARLKVAQQHLAKKVKEAAVLSEKLEEQQTHLTDFNQTIEEQKTQLVHLQASVDLYQRQEKRLQEQLHEALKGTESQIVKWEEKYFRMYDKWQESENRIRELKKYEEKHLQMQSLLANLGNFMGGALNPANALFPSNQEMTEHSSSPSFAFEVPLNHEPTSEAQFTEFQEDRYDVFGMPKPSDNSQTYPLT